jgi:hypothetical protein
MSEKKKGLFSDPRWHEPPYYRVIRKLSDAPKEKHEATIKAKKKALARGHITQEEFDYFVNN